MDSKKKFTARLELSNRERDVVRGVAENRFAWQRLHADDARDILYEGIVRHKHGDYESAFERLTPEPMWGLVFEKKACPACNSDRELMGKEPQVIVKKAGDMVCEGCDFRVPAKTWVAAKKASAEEERIRKKEKEFDGMVVKYDFKKEHLDELVKKGVQEAQRAIRATRPVREKDE